MFSCRLESDIDAVVRTPILIIDGKQVTLTELVRMLMTFEGWQFKPEIRDMRDEA